MARRCEICGKEPQWGHQVSHAHNVSQKIWYPNLQKVRAVVAGTVKRLRVCTRCIKAGKVTKAA